jgi:hypothetical protein
MTYDKHVYVGILYTSVVIHTSTGRLLVSLGSTGSLYANHAAVQLFTVHLGYGLLRVGKVSERHKPEATVIYIQW